MISARQSVIFICFLLVLDAVILCRRRSDVVTFVAVTVGFALVGLGAALIPTMLGARLDPWRALRIE